MSLYYEKKLPIDKLCTLQPAEDLDEVIADLKSGSVSIP